jgi:hypothetical protein
MGAHHHRQARGGLEPIVCECIAHAVYVAHLTWAPPIWPTCTNRLLDQAHENANAAQFYRASAPPPLRRQPGPRDGNHVRQEQVAAELRRLAATVVTDHAEQL